MFIRYQTVRNVVLGAIVVVGAGVVYSAMSSNNDRTPQRNHSAMANRATAHRPAQTQQPVVPRDTVTPPVDNSARAQVTAEQIPTRETFEPAPQNPAQRTPANKPPSKEQLYAQAMTIALRPAGGKGKDVLGPGSPWKLNLYDDNNDGQWDRGKLDTNRDEVDDEKWNFKEGRWEKDGGRTMWQNGKWVSSTRSTSTVRAQPPKANTNLARYRAAMKIATSRVDRPGKDVLGPSSPWKLNLYDDDGDGQWDRGKLDTNRDEVDDEKWNFKNGRWEKDGGRTLWLDDNWADTRSTPTPSKPRTPPVDAVLARYRAAMKIATSRADRSGKGKDVLGGSSPWKLNLYDDDGDGKWDRGKLDSNRDEVEDEKWNFKKGRWEKDGGKTIWRDGRWQPAAK